MIIGDVGESSYEEIDWSAAPTSGKNLNFGWGAEGPAGTGGQRPVAPTPTTRPTRSARSSVVT